MLDEPHVKYMARHGLIGSGVGWLVAGAVLAFDLGGLWTLMSQTNVTWIGAFMVCFVMGTTLGALQMGLAINALSERADWMPGWLKRGIRSLGALPAV